MTDNKHLANAKEYIARGEDYYRKAGEEMLSAKGDGWTTAAIARELGRSRSWVEGIISWSTKCSGSAAPFGGDEENTARYERQAKQALADPERRRKALTEMAPAEVEEIRRDVAEITIERARAKRAEKSTEPTVRDLEGDEKFDPSVAWLDSNIVSMDAKVAAVHGKFEKYGLVLGSLSNDEAYEYLNRIESRVAEIRAAIQERVRDEVTA